jgi:hypothetical protein
MSSWISPWMERLAMLFESIPTYLIESPSSFSNQDRQAQMDMMESFITFWFTCPSSSYSVNSVAHSYWIQQMEIHLTDFLIQNATILRHLQRANVEAVAHPLEMVSAMEYTQFVYDLLGSLIQFTATCSLQHHPKASNEELHWVHELVIRYSWRTFQMRFAAHPPMAPDRLRDLIHIYRELILHDVMYGDSKLFCHSLELAGVQDRQEFRQEVLSQTSLICSPKRRRENPPFRGREDEADHLKLSHFQCRFMPRDGNCQVRRNMFARACCELRSLCPTELLTCALVSFMHWLIN